MMLRDWNLRGAVLMVLALACAALAGCGSTPVPHLLSLPLPALATSPPATAGTPVAQVLTVRRINIPEYLQSDKVRYRSADSTLAEWPGTAWADRLEAGLTDHLVMRLRLALPGWVVCERACPSQTATTPVLTVDLAPLDYVRSAGQLQADVRWQLSTRPERDGSGRLVRSGAKTHVLPVAPDSAEGQAAALGHLLDALSQDVASKLRP